MTPHAAAQARPQGAEAVWHCQCGAGLDEACQTPSKACRIDAEFVNYRLEAAGATLLAMRTRSPYPGLYRCALPEVLQSVIEAYGWAAAEYRPPIPDAAAITRMDAVFAWFALIPSRRHVLRRIVALRCLTHPLSGRHLVQWKRLGVLLHCDYRATQNWHAEGINLIVSGLVDKA